MPRAILRVLSTASSVLVVLVAGLALAMRANFPEKTPEVRANAPGQAAGDETSILIFSGSRNMGLEVTRLLRVRGDTVTALVRPTADRSESENPGIEFVVGDATHLDSV
jgi:hypothetical protein